MPDDILPVIPCPDLIYVPVPDSVTCRKCSAGNKKRPPARMTGRYCLARYDAARHVLTIIGSLLMILNLTPQSLGFILHTLDT